MYYIFNLLKIILYLLNTDQINTSIQIGLFNIIQFDLLYVNGHKDVLLKSILIFLVFKFLQIPFFIPILVTLQISFHFIFKFHFGQCPKCVRGAMPKNYQVQRAIASMLFGIYKVCLMGHTWYIHLDTIARSFIHTNVSPLIRLSTPLQYQLPFK